MKPDISIIIVNWNGFQHLADCLDSIAEQSYRDFEVILVDNGSTDESVPFVRENYPWVKLVLLTENTGFATGNNRGYQQAVGRYIVTLNNDTRVAKNWLERLIAVAEAHSRAGMVGCRICSFFDSELIDSVGMGICADGMSRGMYRNKRWSDLNLPEVVEVLFPSACAALYRREMIDQIGFFDDDFFAYAEDSDLGLRGRLAGWDAVLATEAVVYHKYSQSSGSLSPFKVYLVERNHYWAVLKNLPGRMLLTLPWYTLLRYLEQVRLTLQGGGTGAEFRSGGSQLQIIGVLIKALFDGILSLPKTLHKRRQVMRLKRLNSAEMNALLRRYRISFRELFDLG